MAQTPHDPGPPSWSAEQGEYYVPQQLKTSGMAIASLVCGILGLVTCCAVVPSVLAVVLGGVSMPTIRQGEARGRGLAIAGIVLGILGLVVGLLFWIFVAASREISPVSGREVSVADRSVLEEMGVLEPNEDIELFYSGGMFSIRESGVVITTGRLVLYHGDGRIETAALGNISAIALMPGKSWLQDGRFVVETDAGDLIVFSVAAEEDGDRLFHRVLVRRVSDAREEAGKAAPISEVSPREDDDSATP